MRRLYAAASDQLADRLHAHIQYLDGVKEKWALTDVELEEYNEVPGYLRTCLRDATRQLGLPMESSPDEPSDEIAAIWKQTRPLQKKLPYVSCWER